MAGAVAQSPTPVTANGRLKLVGKQLSNEAGNPIQLRGISSHGLQWFDQCYTQGSVQALATQWGADLFRAAMYVDEGGYLNNQSGLRAKINQIVDWTGQAGIYCIIDWHVLNPGNPNDRLSYAIDFFRTMAQTHAGKKHVIYEICNEPNGVDWNTIKAYADQVIPVIRQYDPQAIILVGTPQWCQRPQDVLANPLTGANAYNVMYTFHYYAGSHYFQNDIRSVSGQLPLFASEWGTSSYTGDGGGDYNNAQAWADLMAGQNPAGQKISWVNWSFADKAESSAALNPGACSNSAWNNTTYSGTWVKDHMLNPADSWAGTTPPPTNQPPTVSLTSPANNAQFTAPASVNLTASAADANGTASKVEFFNGATKLGEDLTAPYTFNWTNVGAGTYTLTAKATDNQGAATTSVAVTVQVTSGTPPPSNQPPTVSLTSPANNAQFTAPASINLTTSAADANGTVSKVEFFNGSTKLGEDLTSPYTFTWANVGAGTYALTARATDNQGATTASATVTIQVNGTTTPPNTGADLVGPDCVRPNDVKVYEMNARNLPNATAFSWWVNGSTQSITPTSAGKVNINFGANYTGGNVCVGVNYSAAPWYAQYCKNVTVCAPGARTGAKDVADGPVFPNPTTDRFSFVAERDIQAMNVVDELGRERLRLGTARAGQTVTFGERLSAGTYLLHIQYEVNNRRVVKLLKAGK
ncbi:hypothetical protein GCM10027423_04280 [Spirosoma arcticum]